MLSLMVLNMPFGEYKQYGIGREDCFEEMYEMIQCKSVHIKLQWAGDRQ